MIKTNKLYYLLMLLVISGLSSCDDDDDLYPQLGDDPRNIAEIVDDNGSLSTFSETLRESNLDSILRTTTTYTVFAPNNTAFDDVNISELNDGQLENLLYNHMLSTVTADFSSTLSTGYVTTMATGPNENNLSLYINTEEETMFNGMAAFVDGSFDIGATNGVLHMVNGVLVPPTVVDHVEANPEFSMLAEAIDLALLSEVLSTIDTENEDYPFTFFAPTNAAFEGLMAQLNGAFGWQTLNDVPADVLQEILTYHVVAGTNTLSGEIAGTEQNSMQGSIFSVNEDNVISDASGVDANLTVTDVQAVNGVVHGVNKVLLPESVYQDILAATLNIVEQSDAKGYSTFLSAVQMLDMTTDLASEEYTLFAPNNDAFIALFAQTSNFGGLNDFDTAQELDILQDIINYHLHSGTLMTSQFTNEGTITTVNGDDITTDLTGENIRLLPSFEEAVPSQIVNANIGATNGIIHEINRVLVPAGLVNALGIETEGGPCPVGDPSMVFYDWDGNDPWWGNVTAENDPSITLDGSNYGRANFQTGGTGFIDLFWRNDASTFNGAQTVGSNLDDYSLKFDINVMEPINDGRFRFRFHDSDGVDVFYDWAPWDETGQPYSTDGWETIEIPLSVIGVPDYSLIDAEFGMAFQDADVFLDFAIDNVRFDTPGCGSGPDPVEDEDLVFYDWDGNDPWWGNVAAENDPAISLDGSNYGRANFQTGSTGWVDMFWRNDGSTFNGAQTVGSNINDYVIKFDIKTMQPISEGMFRFRFNATAGVDAMYDWEPWNDTGEDFDTEGEWVTVSIPASAFGQPDFSQVDAEFGMAFEGADVFLDFAIDNVRFEEL